MQQHSDKFLFCFLIVCLLCSCGTSLSFGTGTRTFLNKVWSNTKSFLGSCGYVNNPVVVLDDKAAGLRSRVISQDWAIDNIVETLESHFRQSDTPSSSGNPNLPAFLYFIGTTGVGKTFTAQNIAELVQDNDRGPLVLRGENYNDPTYSTATYHREIRTLLKNKLSTCNGDHVIIFDEVQKVAPQILDIFNPILELGQFDFVNEKGNVETINCHNAIFIFISDFGTGEIIDAVILEKNNDLNRRRRVHMAIQQKFESDKAMSFLGNINAIVPFLPLRERDVKKVLRKQLDDMVQKWNAEKWMMVTFDDLYYKYLSAPPHIDYFTIEIMDEKHTDEVMSGDFAEFGARGVAMTVKNVETQLHRIWRHKLKKRPLANLRVSLLTEKRCVVEGIAHYDTQITACFNETCEPDEWESMFAGDIIHGMVKKRDK